MLPVVPPEVSKNDPILAEWMNQLRAAIIARTPLPSKGMRYKRTAAGYHATPVLVPGGAEEVGILEGVRICTDHITGAFVTGTIFFIPDPP